MARKGAKRGGASPCRSRFSSASCSRRGGTEKTITTPRVVVVVAATRWCWNGIKIIIIIIAKSSSLGKEDTNSYAQTLSTRRTSTRRRKKKKNGLVKFWSSLSLSRKNEGKPSRGQKLREDVVRSEPSSRLERTRKNRIDRKHRAHVKRFLPCANRRLKSTSHRWVYLQRKSKPSF